MQAATDAKRCPSCDSDLPLTAFNCDRSRPDGVEATCRACKNARRRERRNQPGGRDADKAYRARPEVKARRRARWPERKVRERDQRRAYWQRPDVKARNRQRQRGDSARKREYAAAYRARLRGQETDRPSEDWLLVLLADPCPYCGAPSEEIDHVEPVSRGGEHGTANLVGTCRHCNRSKRDRPLLEVLLHA